MATPEVNHILPNTSNAHKMESTPKDTALKSISCDDLLQNIQCMLYTKTLTSFLNFFETYSV
jgi:hypothetical protein